MSSSPTLIIAHGAFHQASHYHDFTNSLHKIGLTEVRTPQLPSSGSSPPEDAFANDVAELRRTIAEELESGNDVVIIAHSYGSMPLTEALLNLPQSTSELGKILNIIFVAAMVPDQGESLATAMKTGVAPWVKIEGAICYAENPSNTFFNTLKDASLLESAVAQISPQASAAFITPVTDASWKHYPCTYFKCMQDNSTSLVDQDHMIEKLKRENALVQEVDIQSDHCPFLNMSDELAEMMSESMRTSQEHKAQQIV